ncbi:unnamed protein product [Adineta ricciae]|uniref:Uncharacterized protein n=1 Tax=Adineta ricciae TaxID=249248 RepID=A0A815BJI9_ADIRI|nr:unnamed protein product [Adineta ricciae]CAF1270768.1 unnamed protein product [Adineta ricciae]
MAVDASGTKLTQLTKYELILEVKRLQTKNTELRQKLSQAESVASSNACLLEAAKLRSAKHRNEKERLQRLDRLWRMARIMVVFGSVLLIIYAAALAVDEHGLSGVKIPPKLLSTNYKWVVDDRIGSFLVGCLGFIISIPSQLTFPAPYLSFAGASFFAAAQIIVQFLSKWYIVCLILFAMVAMFALNSDRKKQVSLSNLISSNRNHYLIPHAKIL